MKKRIIGLSLTLVAGSAGHAFAQDASDALRYSRLQFGGPARTQGIGGANVALGADFGNLTSNPAGLGLFQKSEVHFTPGIGIGQSDGRIEGNAGAATNATKNSFHVASGGVVFASRHPDNDNSTWRGGALALGFSRLADFNMSSRYQGTLSNTQSYLARLRPDAGVRNQPFYNNLDDQAANNDYTTNLGLAYGAYLANIAAFRGTTTDSAVVLRRQGNVVNQTERVVNAGSMSQFDVGYGGSYRDRLYIGAAIGFVSSNFTQTRTLIESDNDLTTHFESLTSTTELRTKGTGINGRLGLIFRALDNLRIGASVQTPTYIRLTDTYSESLTGTFSAQGTDRVPRDLPVGQGPRVSFPTYDYAYTLTTPFRANGGVAYTLGKHGFLTGDIEYVGYGQARLHSDPDNANGSSASFDDANDNIQNVYQNAVNLRFGAEGRFDVFRVRLGYARYGDPYKEDTDNARAQNFYTAGLGLRQGNFFLDAAGVYTTVNQYYAPYSLQNGSQPVVKVDGSRYTTTITAGLTF